MKTNLKKKKILIVTCTSGFLPQFESENVKILDELGYEIFYASNFNNRAYEYSENWFKENKINTFHVSIEKSPKKIWKNYKAYKQIVSIIEKEDIDYVHCHNPVGSVVARIASKKSKRKPKVIYTCHGFHFYYKSPILNWMIYYPIEKWMAHFTDYLITINYEDYMYACGFDLKDKGEAIRIPGVGVDLCRFSSNSNTRVEKRKELGIKADAFFLLSVGELNDNKNHETIIKAIARIENANIVYGICGEGPNFKKLQSLIDKLNLRSKIILLGFRRDIDEVLKAADCFGFPSKREGLGMAALEAMATEVPVIALDNRGTREYIKHMENGFSVYENNAESFAEAIKKMIELSENEYKEMKSKCRLTAEKFSIFKTVEIMKDVYTEVIK